MKCLNGEMRSGYGKFSNSTLFLIFRNWEEQNLKKNGEPNQRSSHLESHEHLSPWIQK